MNRRQLRKNRGVARASGLLASWKDRGPSSPRRGAIFSLSWGRGRGEGGRFSSRHFHESPNPRRGVRSPEPSEAANTRAKSRFGEPDFPRNDSLHFLPSSPVSVFRRVGVRIGLGTNSTPAKTSAREIVIPSEGKESAASQPTASCNNHCPLSCRTNCSMRGSFWLTSRYSRSEGIRR